MSEEKKFIYNHLKEYIETNGKNKFLEDYKYLSYQKQLAKDIGNKNLFEGFGENELTIYLKKLVNQIKKGELVFEYKPKSKKLLELISTKPVPKADTKKRKLDKIFKVITENIKLLETPAGNMYQRNTKSGNNQKFISELIKLIIVNETFINENYNEIFDHYEKEFSKNKTPKTITPKEIKPKTLKKKPEPIITLEVEGKLEPMQFQIEPSVFIPLTDEESKEAYRRAEEIEKQEKIKEQRFNNEQIKKNLGKPKKIF